LQFPFKKFSTLAANVEKIGHLSIFLKKCQNDEGTMVDLLHTDKYLGVVEM